MIAIPSHKVLDLIKVFDVELAQQRENAISKLKELQKVTRSPENKVHETFLQDLISEFESENIITASIDEIENLKKKLKEVPETIQPPTKIKTLKDEIIDALGYDIKRSKFYPEYFSKLGIKSCVYCNTQYTLALEKNTFTDSGDKTENKTWVAKFQVDHFYDQSKYPYLSISLFNLIPCCATCNNIKSNNPVTFQLYTDVVKPSGFLFSITEASKSKYLTSLKSEELEINFYDPLKKNNHNEVKGSFEDTFHISKIYDTQKDRAEELILISQMYNSKYKKTLIDNFEKAIPSDDLFYRTLIGNYTEPQDIHKRPMSKFTQDIARQLGLIK